MWLHMIFQLHFADTPGHSAYKTSQTYHTDLENQELSRLSFHSHHSRLPRSAVLLSLTNATVGRWHRHLFGQEVLLRHLTTAAASRLHEESVVCPVRLVQWTGFVESIVRTMEKRPHGFIHERPHAQPDNQQKGRKKIAQLENPGIS